MDMEVEVEVETGLKNDSNLSKKEEKSRYCLTNNNITNISLFFQSSNTSPV